MVLLVNFIITLLNMFFIVYDVFHSSSAYFQYQAFDANPVQWSKSTEQSSGPNQLSNPVVQIN